MVRVQQKARGRTTGSAGAAGIPCAMVLRLIRALPGDQALLSPSSADRSANLAPAQGRQDHTTSPSASCCSSDNTPRPSHPASNVRDDREAPLMRRRDAREDRFDLPDDARGKCATHWHDGQFAHGGDAQRRSLLRHCERQRSNPNDLRGNSPDCFVVSAPRNDDG